MEEFKLKLNYAIHFDLEGMDAVNFLEKHGIEDNKFNRSKKLAFYFNLEEVKASKLLSTIFKEDRDTAWSVSCGKFNECADINKLYNDNDDWQKENSKEEFYKKVNYLIGQREMLAYKKDDNHFSLEGKFSSYTSIMRNILSHTFKKYFLDDDAIKNFCSGSWTYIENLKEGTFEDFQKDFYNELDECKFDIGKMKKAEEQQQKETENEIAYNDMLLKKWKSEEIAVNIDTEKDNLTDVIKFIKNEGDESDFDFNEEMLKAFADKGKFRIYMEDGDFSMDVYERLPEITWNQIIGVDKIKPIEQLVELFKDGKIAIKPQSEEDIKSICDWVSKEFSKESTEIILDHVHNWDTLMYIEKNDEENKITFDVEGGANLKVYSWEQFLGLELLNLYCSTLKNFSSHEWAKFYEDKGGQPNVEWKEGCHNVGLEAFEGFEQRVEDKYGDRKEEPTYRTYMLESDKLRLAMGLPTRTIGLGGTVIKVCNFKNLFKERKEQVDKWITSSASESDDYYVPKNMLWLLRAYAADSNDFQYLGSNDDFYYDLVTIDYLDQKFAIPVPVISKILDVPEQSIYDCFAEHYNRDEEEFI